MPYRILPTKEFEKDFRKIDSFVQQKIKKKVEEVAENPTKYNENQRFPAYRKHKMFSSTSIFTMIWQEVADYGLEN